MTGTWWQRLFPKRRPAAARRPRGNARPRLETLEDRLTPTTNLVVSFGNTQLLPNNAKGYLIPATGIELGTAGSFEQFIPTNPTLLGFSYTAWKGFAAPGEAQATPQERLAEIQYVLAGVRQDMAPLDVNVIWDDRGADSPFYRAGTGDTLSVVTDNQDVDAGFPIPGLYGISSSVDGDTLERVGLNGATSGTFQLRFNGQTTVPIPFNASTAQVTAALLALPNIGFNNGGNGIGIGPQPNVIVGQDVRNGDFLVEFTEALGQKDQNLMTVVGSTLRGGTGPATVSSIYHGGGNARLDTTVVFAPTAAVPPAGLPATENRQLRELIDTISHEAGHTWSISHDFENDPEQRQLTASIPQDNNGANNTFLDSRFSPYVLVHGPLDSGARYAELARLYSPGYIGASPTTPYGVQFPDFQSSQNLPPPPEPGNPNVPSAYSVQVALGANNSATVTGNLVYVGDRIAYEFTVPAGIGQNVPLLIRMSPLAGSTLAPGLTLWDSGGNWVANGIQSGTDSLAFIRVNSQDTFFVDAGSLTDLNETSGFGPLPASNTLGGFRITIGVGFLPPSPQPQPFNSPLVVVGADAGQEPTVRVFDKAGNNIASFDAYDPAFLGGVRTAVGDVNDDGYLDIATAPGPGGGPHIKIFYGGPGGAFTLGPQYFAYDPQFTGGVFVALGDLNGDRFADVITGAGAGGGPHVRAVDGKGLSQSGSFFPTQLLFNNFVYAPDFLGGVTVAAGDLFGGGYDQIITGAGSGGGPHVKIWSFNPIIGPNATPSFNGAIGLVGQFFAYAPGFLGGVFVASGDVNGDGYDDIVTGAGQTGTPHVKAFDGSLAFAKYTFASANQPGIVGFTTLTTGSTIDGNFPIDSFFAYDATYTTGVHVALADLNGDGRADFITAPASFYGSFTQPVQGLGGNPPGTTSYPFTFPINEPSFVLSDPTQTVQPSAALQVQPNVNIITNAAPGFGVSPGLHFIDALTLGQLTPFDPGLLNGMWVGGG
jgi:hypothetical protein